MTKIELQKEGEFQRRLDANQCIKCLLPLKKISETVRKCEVCNLTITN